MPNARITIYAHKMILGGTTYDKTSGGPFQWTVEKSGQPVQERLELLYPIYVEVVDGTLDLTLTMKDIGKSFQLGQELTNCQAYAKNKSGEVGPISLGTLIVTGVTREQGRAAPGQLVVKFTAETSAGADPNENV